MKKVITTILSIMLVLCLSGCNKEPEITFDVQSYVAHGIECYKYDGIEYPAVFGLPQMLDEEMDLLRKENSFGSVYKSITNLPDCFRYLKAHSIKPGETDDYMDLLENGEGTPRSACNLMIYLLGDVYEESGRIDLYASNNYYAYVCIKIDGIYYLFDPFYLMASNGWYSYIQEGIPVSGRTVDELIDVILETRKNENFSRHEYLSIYRKIASETEAE